MPRGHRSPLLSETRVDGVGLRGRRCGGEHTPKDREGSGGLPRREEDLGRRWSNLVSVDASSLANV
jgi:hypothetical protein